MSYQERRAIATLISTILIPILYAVVMVQRYPEADAYAPEILRFWGSFFLILIPVSVVAKMIIFIMFAIFNAITTGEEEPSITDERDRLVELKSMRNALYAFIVAFFLAIASLAVEQPPAVMFVILFVGGTVSGMVGDLSQFVYYRRGV